MKFQLKNLSRLLALAALLASTACRDKDTDKDTAPTNAVDASALLSSLDMSHDRLDAYDQSVRCSAIEEFFTKYVSSHGIAARLSNFQCLERAAIESFHTIFDFKLEEGQRSENIGVIFKDLIGGQLPNAEWRNTSRVDDADFQELSGFSPKIAAMGKVFAVFAERQAAEAPVFGRAYDEFVTEAIRVLERDGLNGIPVKFVPAGQGARYGKFFFQGVPDDLWGKDLVFNCSTAACLRKEHVYAFASTIVSFTRRVDADERPIDFANASGEFSGFSKTFPTFPR